jgi:hypothetical protein
MKTAITSLVLFAAALLPTYSFASTDRISAEPGTHCEFAMTTVVIGDAKADPMEAQVNALVNSTSDPVLASYYRDLYRADGSFPTVTFITMPDPYVNAITLALYGTVEPESRMVC